MENKKHFIYAVAICYLLLCSICFGAKRVSYIVSDTTTIGRDTILVKWIRQKMGYTVTLRPESFVTSQPLSYWTTNSDMVVISRRVSGVAAGVARLDSVAIPKLILHPSAGDEFKLSTITVTNSGLSNTVVGGLTSMHLAKRNALHPITFLTSDTLYLRNPPDENANAWWSWGGLAPGVARLYAISWGVGYYANPDYPPGPQNISGVKISSVWNDTVWVGAIDVGGVRTDGSLSNSKIAFSSLMEPMLNPADQEATVGWHHPYEVTKRIFAWLLDDYTNPYVVGYHAWSTDFHECEICWTEIGGADNAFTYNNWRWGVDSDGGASPGKVLSFLKINDMDKKIPVGQRADSMIVTVYCVQANINGGNGSNPADFAGFNFRVDWYAIKSSVHDWTCPYAGGSAGSVGTPAKPFVNRYNVYNDGTTVVPWSARDLVPGVDMAATPFDTTRCNSVDPVDPFVLGDSIKIKIPAVVLQKWIDFPDSNRGIVGKPYSYVNSYAPNDVELIQRDPRAVTSSTVSRYELYTSSYGIPLTQSWRDTSKGILDQDTLYSMVENISSSKWGLIVASNGVKVNLNGYQLKYDDNDSTLVAVTNKGFETPDTDTNKAAGWDFTDAPNTKRKAGHYLLNADADRSSLYEGNYALAVQTPCPDQVVKSSSLYTFPADRHWCVSAMAYNYVSGGGNIRFVMCLINAAGDTVRKATCVEGNFQRGFMPVWTEIITGATPEQYRIGLKVIGAGAAGAGYVYFDDVRIQTYKYHGVVIGCDTVRNDVSYMSGSYDKYMPGQSYKYYGTSGTGTKIYGGGRLVQGGGRSFGGKGIFGNYTCPDDTISGITIENRGVANVNVFSNSFIRWEVKACSLLLASPYGTKRDGLTVCNVKGEGGGVDGGYGSTVWYNYMWGSVHVGVSTWTHPDYTHDGVDSFPLNRVWYNKIQHRNKYANGFGIISYGGHALADVRYNLIVSDTGVFCGRGIQLANMDTTVEQTPVLIGNVVQVQQLDNFQEYQYGREAFACQVEGTKGLIQRGNKWIARSNDYIYARTGQKKMGSAALRASASDWTDEGRNIDWTCVGDTFIARSYGRDWSIAASVLGLDSARVRFDSCVLISNDCFIQMGEIGGTFFPTNTKFVVDTSFTAGVHLNKTAGTFTPFVGNESVVAQLNVVDPRFQDNLIRDSIRLTHLFRGSFYNVYNTPDLYGRWRYGWTHTADVDSGAFAVVGANIYIKATTGEIVAAGTTDAQGRFISYLYEFVDSAKASPYLQSRDRTGLNDYLVTVNYNGQEMDTVVTIDAKKTTQMNFAGFVTSITRLIINRIGISGASVR